MPIRITEFFDLGGVDSRSNPLNMPIGRSLRCLNFRPIQDGSLQLRDGYATLTQSSVTVSQIHSMVPYADWSGNDYVLFFQGLTAKKYAVASGTVTSPTVRGTAIASSAKVGSFAAQQNIYFGNGTDQKVFDGTTIRNNGIRAMVDADISSVIVIEGVREHTTAELAAVTLASSGAAGLATSTKGGYLIYSAIFDTVEQELGPATLPVRSTTRLAITAGPKQVDVAGLPSLAAVNVNWVKLIARTDDGGDRASFVTTTSTAATLTRSGSTITITSTAHGLVAGDVFIASVFPHTEYNRPWCVATAPDANTITVTLGSSQIAANFAASDTGGTIKKILKVANATTTGTINVSTTDSSYLVNQDRGLPASSVGGAQPGYQFSAAIANQTTTHVGNYIAIGGRKAPTTRTNYRITGLPSLSSEDTEWSLQIGRSGDGGVDQHPITDAAGNFKYCGNTDTVITIVDPSSDGNREMPTRNGVIPATCNKFAVVGDYAYAADSISAQVRRSGSQAADNGGDFLGDPYQSWSPNDLDTFPTHDVPTCIAEFDYELIVGTKTDSAILSNLSGFQAWRGPWNVGFAGPRAFCKTGNWGFFWLTGDKQIASVVNGAPVPVSEEFDSALLNQISDANISTVELVYQNIPEKLIDRLVVKGLNSSSQPVHVYFDFKLREGRSPLGQGYSSQFASTSPLGSTNDYTIARFKNSSGRSATFAGSSVGQLYELQSGSTDAGAEFSADYISLLNAGEDRKTIPQVEWYGDGNVVVSVGQKLNLAVADYEVLTTEASAAGEGADDYHYVAKLTKPEIIKAYLRFQLTSHSADGSLALNTAVHLPIENYGRIYCVNPGFGESRGR